MPFGKGLYADVVSDDIHIGTFRKKNSNDIFTLILHIKDLHLRWRLDRFAVFRWSRVLIRLCCRFFRDAVRFHQHLCRRQIRPNVAPVLFVEFTNFVANDPEHSSQRNHESRKNCNCRRCHYLLCVHFSCLSFMSFTLK